MINATRLRRLVGSSQRSEFSRRPARHCCTNPCLLAEWTILCCVRAVRPFSLNAAKKLCALVVLRSSSETLTLQTSALRKQEGCSSGNSSVSTQAPNLRTVTISNYLPLTTLASASSSSSNPSGNSAFSSAATSGTTASKCPDASNFDAAWEP